MALVIQIILIYYTTLLYRWMPSINIIDTMVTRTVSLEQTDNPTEYEIKDTLRPRVRAQSPVDLGEEFADSPENLEASAKFTPDEASIKITDDSGNIVTQGVCGCRPLITGCEESLGCGILCILSFGVWCVCCRVIQLRCRILCRD